MERALAVSIGQCSDKGRKDINQDFHGAIVPTGTPLSLKGIVLALADGVSSSPVAHIAAETAVRTFLSDYYCTSEAWSVRQAGLSVIAATNGWLYNETRRNRDAEYRDRGYVCTFSALVLKGRFAHTFHIGDARIYRVSGDSLEPLTQDHRVVISADQHYLSRAIGIGEFVDVDYDSHALVTGDMFILGTDGVHEHVGTKEIIHLIRANADDLDRAARSIVDLAIANGSDDNLTLQIVRIEDLPDGAAIDYTGQVEALPPPPLLDPPVEFEGYFLSRTIHSNDRSHIYFATDNDTGNQVALKIPAMALRHEPSLLRQFMMEEWIARRVSSPHIVKAHLSPRPRRHLFVVMEHVDGQSLRQWMHDHPQPDLVAVRDIVDQIIKGLRALHRKEMIHGDLRPENIMIDRHGTVKIIDFGSVRVAGLAEAAGEPASVEILGSVQYTAPECMTGDTPTWRSDLFSAAAIAYEMLTGDLPYGASAARVRTPAEQRALRYRSARSAENAVPDWIDGALRTALHPDPYKRHNSLSEFIRDLNVPNRKFLLSQREPLLERDPVAFWKWLSLLLALTIVALLAFLRR